MLERTCVYEQMHANRKKLPYTVIFKNQYVAINIPAPGFQAGGQLVVTDGWWWMVDGGWWMVDGGGWVPKRFFDFAETFVR